MSERLVAVALIAFVVGIPTGWMIVRWVVG
jgi:hypothetical protein